MPVPTDPAARFELDLPGAADVRPTDADLDAFEARFAVRLPDSYRRFVRALGAGLIEGFPVTCRIYAPGGPPGDHPRADLALLNAFEPISLSAARLLRDRTAWPGSPPDLVALRDRVAGMIFFCLAADGDDQFAWDPADVTDPAAHEMAICLVQVDPRKVTRVAATFGEFVDYLLSGRYARENFPGDPDNALIDPARVATYAQHRYARPGDDDDDDE